VRGFSMGRWLRSVTAMPLLRRCVRFARMGCYIKRRVLR
jgi:hypothetical protein